jgi:putative tryptophan/tyrosine transport system substrate-binding protein
MRAGYPIVKSPVSFAATGQPMVLGQMQRRDFITLLGAAAASPLLCPLAARAQQSKRSPRIGVLWPNPPATFEFMRQGLKDFGYVEGQNIGFEFRWAEGKLDQLPELAAELVRLQVDVIVTLAPQATLAAKHATQTIPIVFVAMGDPLASGVVASLARPGANLTGTTRMISEMSVKHVELLKEAVPSLAKLAVLWNPTNSSHRPALQAVDAAARSLSLPIHPLEVRAVADLDGVFAAIVGERADGVLFIADPVFYIQLRRMVDFVASKRLPAIANFIEFPKLGGLMGYAPSIPDEFRHAAGHIDKILKGAKPGDLPIEQPTRFQLVINLKTAKALGVEMPPMLLARADEVIE